MNRLLNPDGSVSLDEVRKLHGRIVLVKSARDTHNPPAGLRGTLEVHDQADGTPTVSIAVDFPQMFTTRAHRRTIPLDHPGLLHLLETEDYGAFTYTLNDDLA